MPAFGHESSLKENTSGVKYVALGANSLKIIQMVKNTVLGISGLQCLE